MKKKIITISLCASLIIVAIILGAVLNQVPASPMEKVGENAKFSTKTDIYNALISPIWDPYKCYTTDLSSTTKDYSSGTIYDTLILTEIGVGSETQIHQNSEYYYNSGEIHVKSNGTYYAQGLLETMKCSFEYEYCIGYKKAFLMFRSFELGYSYEKSPLANYDPEEIKDDLLSQGRLIRKKLNKWIDLSEPKGGNDTYRQTREGLISSLFGNLTTTRGSSLYFVMYIMSESTKGHSFNNYAPRVLAAEENEESEKTGEYSHNDQSAKHDWLTFSIINPYTISFEREFEFSEHSKLFEKSRLSYVNNTKVSLPEESNCIKATDLIKESEKETRW